MAPDPGCHAGALLWQLMSAHIAMVNMLLAFTHPLPPAAASPSTTSSSSPTSAPTSATSSPPSMAPRTALCLYDLLGMNEGIPNCMKPSGPHVCPGLNERALGGVKDSCMTKCNPDGAKAPSVAWLPRVHPAGAHPGDFAADASLHDICCTNVCFSDGGVLTSTTDECSYDPNGVKASLNEGSNVLKFPCMTECLSDGVRASCQNVRLPDGALASCMNECLPDGVLAPDLNEGSSDDVSAHSLNESTPDYEMPCSEEDDVLNPHFEAFIDSLTLDEFKVWESDAYDHFEPHLKTPKARKRKPAKKKIFPSNECVHSADFPSGPGKANILKSDPPRSDGNAAKKKFFTSNINTAAGSAAPCTGPPRALL